jgi:ATP-binding cassette subfamily F protein 3
MIDFINISKAFGTRDILRDVSFRVDGGEKIGITGPNGAGKSTIFRLIAGEMSPDAGTVSRARDLTIGYLHQEPQPSHREQSLLEFTENALADLRDIEIQMTVLEHRLASRPQNSQADLQQLGHLQTRFENMGGYERRTRAEKALSGLGFAAADFTRPFEEFSGGWRMRAELARTLVALPHVLLLDEPTNYLDVPAVEWLREFLSNWPGTLLLISHDRYLLNQLTSITLEVTGGKVTRYPGNYEYYAEARKQRHAQLQAARQNQDRRRAQLERFVERFKAKNTKASQAQSRQKMLDKMVEIEVPELAGPPPRIRLAQPPRCGYEVVRLENAGFSYDNQQWVFRNLDLTIERGMKSVVVGPNGRGKTTLLRLAAGTMPPSAGNRQIAANVVTGYLAQDYTDAMAPLDTVYAAAKAVAPEAKENEVRNLLGSFRFSGDDIEKKVEVLSGGEKVRLALARLLLSNPNFLVLDEPTTHLDIPSREALESALVSYQGTVLLVSHDIQFIRRVATTVFELTASGVVRYYGDYDYYRRKRAEAQSAGTAPAGKSEPPRATANDADATPDRRQQRQMEAASRNALYKAKLPLQKRADKAEKATEQLHREQNALLAAMQSEAAGKNLAEMTRRLSCINRELQDLTREWEEAMLAIEELEEMHGVPVEKG